MKYEEDFKKTFNISYDELPTKVIFLDYKGVIDTSSHINVTNTVIVIFSSLRYS